MGIVYADEESNIRSSILLTLQDLLQRHNLRICDVGGGVRSEFSSVTTDVIDFFSPFHKDISHDKIVHIGDINEMETWLKFTDKYFDFVICTHTLEDIRDPLFVVKQISRASRAGFISVPNRFKELNAIEEKYWNGFYHHRWIFHFAEGSFQAIAKFAPFVLPSNTLDFVLKKFYIFLNKLPTRYLKGSRLLKKNVSLSNIQKRKNVHREDSELSILWVDDLNLVLFNRDYAGHNKMEGINLCRTFISQKFDYSFTDLQEALKVLKHQLTP